MCAPPPHNVNDIKNVYQIYRNSTTDHEKDTSFKGQYIRNHLMELEGNKNTDVSCNFIRTTINDNLVFSKVAIAVTAFILFVLMRKRA
jgi:hypothetical protein